MQISSKINPDLHEAIRFVSKAIDKPDLDGFRPHTWLINVRSEKDPDATTITGTDGMRLHRARIENPAAKVPDGGYRVVKNTKTLIVIDPYPDPIEYPDVDPLLVGLSDMESGGVEHDRIDWSGEDNIHAAIFCLARVTAPHEVYYNVDFLRDAFEGSDWTIYIPKNGVCLSATSQTGNITRSVFIAPVKK